MLASLDVSFGSAMLAPPLKRLTRKSGEAANVSPVPSRAVFVWAAFADDCDEPVLEVAVLRGDEAPPAPACGRWRKVRRDLSSGRARVPSFLAYRVGAASEAAPPIAAVAVVAPGEEPGASCSGLLGVRVCGRDWTAV